MVLDVLYNDGLLIFQGVETTDANSFITPENVERLKQAIEANRVQVGLYSLLLLLTQLGEYVIELPHSAGDVRFMLA